MLFLHVVISSTAASCVRVCTPCVTLEAGTFSPDMLTLGQVDVWGKEHTRCLCKHTLYASGPRCWGHLLDDIHLKSTVTLCIYHNTVNIKNFHEASPSSLRCMNKHTRPTLPVCPLPPSFLCYPSFASRENTFPSLLSASCRYISLFYVCWESEDLCNSCCLLKDRD